MDGRREGLEDTILSLVEGIEDSNRIIADGNDDFDGFFDETQELRVDLMPVEMELSIDELGQKILTDVQSVNSSVGSNPVEKEAKPKTQEILEEDIERPVWDTLYRKYYNDGLKAYGENRIEDAYAKFDSALQIIEKAKTYAVEWRDTLLLKENACIYMKLYALNSQMSEPERVMRNLHDLKHAMYDYFARNLIVDAEISNSTAWSYLRQKAEKEEIELDDLADFLDLYHRFIIRKLIIEFKGQIPTNSTSFRSILELEEVNNTAPIDYARQCDLIEQIHEEYFASVRGSEAFLSPFQRKFYKNIENLWTAHFILNRCASMSFQFYSRSFLVKESISILPHSENSSYGALIGKMMIPQELVDEDNRNTKILPWMVNQTEHWIKEMPDIEKLEAVLLITGDQDIKFMSISSNLYNDSIKTIVSYQSGNEENIHDADFEHSIRMVVLYNFSNGLDNLDNFGKHFNEIEKYYQIALNYPFCKKVALLAKTLQARLLTEYIIHVVASGKRPEDFKKLTWKVHDIFEQAKSHLEPGNDNIDIVAHTYLNLVEPTVNLMEMEMMDTEELYEENSLIPDITISNELIHRNELGRGFLLKRVGQIFEHFKDTFNDDHQIVRKLTGLQRFEAEKFFILSKALFQEISFRVHMLTGGGKSKKEIVKKDKDILIVLITRAEALLCESFRTLAAIGSSDKPLKFSIYRLYLNLMRFHLELTGVPESNISRVMKNTDMDDVLESFLRQEWTDALREICEKTTHKSSDDYKISVVSTYKEALRHLAPFVSQVTIIEKDGNNTIMSMYPLDEEKIELFKEVLERKRETAGDIFEKYCYSQKPDRKKGTFVTCIKLNDNQELVIESAYQFTGSIISEIIEITKGLKSLLAIYSSRFDSVGKKASQKENDEHQAIIVEQINHRHMPTVRHSQRMARFVEAFCGYWNNTFPNISLDTEHLKIKARKHDAGKMYLHPRILLQKDGRLSDSEYEEVLNHPPYGYVFCSTVIGTNDDVVPHGHHQGYGVDCKKYPFGDLVGRKIKELPQRFSTLMPGRGGKGELTDLQVIEVRALCSIDIVEALTSTDRIYRSPMSLEAIVGYLCDRAGKEIDPRFAYIFIDAVNSGYFDHLIFGKSFVEGLKKYFDEKLLAVPDDIIERVVAFLTANFEEILRMKDDMEITLVEEERCKQMSVVALFSKSRIEDLHTDDERKMFIKYMMQKEGLSLEMRNKKFQYPEIYRLDDIIEYLRGTALQYGSEKIDDDITTMDQSIFELENELERLNIMIVETGEKLIDLWSGSYILDLEVIYDIQKLRVNNGDNVTMMTKYSIYEKVLMSLIRNEKLINADEFLEYFKYYGSRKNYIEREIKKFKEKKIRAVQYKERIPQIIDSIARKFEEGKSHGLLMSSDAFDSTFRGELFEYAKSYYPDLKSMEDRDAESYNEMIREDARQFLNPLNNFKAGFLKWAQEREIEPMSRAAVMNRPLGFS